MLNSDFKFHWQKRVSCSQVSNLVPAASADKSLKRMRNGDKPGDGAINNIEGRAFHFSFIRSRCLPQKAREFGS